MDILGATVFTAVTTITIAETTRLLPCYQVAGLLANVHSSAFTIQCNYLHQLHYCLPWSMLATFLIIDIVFAKFMDAGIHYSFEVYFLVKTPCSFFLPS